MKDNKVLLAKRAWEPKKGYYDVVGGFLEYGELPEQGAKREVLEETGAKVKIIKLLGIYPDGYKHKGRVYKTINPIYIGRLLGNKIKAKDDVAELKWFLIDSLPKNIAFKCVAEGLKDLKKWFKSSRGKKSRTSAASYSPFIARLKTVSSLQVGKRSEG